MMRGFTIFELLLVIAAGLVLSALTLPVGFRFFQMQQLEETRADVVSLLRRAEAQSMFAKNDAQFGVKLLSSSFVLFQGTSYAGRVPTEDEVYPLNAILSFSGSDEFVFSKLYGTTTSGTINFKLSSGNEMRTISVNEKGRIQ